MSKTNGTQTQKGKYSSRLSNTAEKFRNSEDFFRMIIQNLKDYAIFTTDIEGVITSWNTGAEEVFGYKEEDVIGKNISIIYSEQDKKNNIPEKELNTARKKGRASDNRWHIKKDGSKFWASGVVLLLEVEEETKGFIKIVQNLTERKKAEIRTQEAKNYAESIVETVQLPILILNEEFIVDSANKAFYKIFKTTQQKVFGKKIFELGNGQWDIRKLRKLLEEVLPKNKKINNMEIKHRFPDLGEKILLINARKLKLEGHSKILLSIEDITQDKKLQQQKDDFLSIVSHETKTPLTSIKAYLQLLIKSIKREEDNKQLYSLASKAEEQTLRLEDLLNELLQSGRHEAGKFSLEEKVVDLNELVEQTVNSFKESIQSHNINLKSKSNPTVCVDPERIEQVLINLLTNAVKYSPNADDVNVEILEDENTAEVRVQDFGVGIEQKNLSKIFERYYRISNKDTGTEGFGLGLYIASQIITEHEGKIWAESEKGKGSIFHFTLPLQKKE